MAYAHPHAIPGPLYMPQYHLSVLDRSHALDDEADGLYQDGTDAKTNDDHYILSTVFFAAVLFLPGSRCASTGVRCASPCSCSPA